MLLKAITLDVTGKCNLKCQHCVSFDKSQYEDLTTEEIFSLLEQMAELGCQHLALAGGEPFCRPDLIDILQRAESLRIFTAILTNGTLLTPEIIRELAQLSNLAYIRVSMDSADSERLAQIRGQENILEMIEESIWALKSAHIPVGLNATIFPHNLDQIALLAKFARKEEVDFIRFVPGVQVGRAENLTISQEFYRELLHQVLKVMKENTDVLKQYALPLAFPTREICDYLQTNCPAGERSCAILPHGQVILCSFLAEKQYNLSIKSLPLAQIFSNLRKIKQGIIKDALTGECGQCDEGYICLGGCLAEKQARMNSRGFLSEQPICLRKILDQVLQTLELDENLKNIFENIIYRHGLSVNSNALPCQRSLAIWIYPFNWSKIF